MKGIAVRCETCHYSFGFAAWIDCNFECANCKTKLPDHIIKDAFNAHSKLINERPQSIKVKFEKEVPVRFDYDECSCMAKYLPIKHKRGCARYGT